DVEYIRKDLISSTSKALDSSLGIMDRIKTFEDACLIEGHDPQRILPYAKPISEEEENTNAFVQAKIICKALNQGWYPDWSNSNENKYYPWFKYSAGSGLSHRVYVCTASFTDVGSRLCFKSSEM